MRRAAVFHDGNDGDACEGGNDGDDGDVDNDSN